MVDLTTQARAQTMNFADFFRRLWFRFVAGPPAPAPAPPATPPAPPAAPTAAPVPAPAPVPVPTPVAVSPARPPSREEFARLMMDRLQENEVEGLAYLPEDYALRIGGPAGKLFFLTNAYQEYTAAEGPARRAEVLSRYVLVNVHPDVAVPEVPDSLDAAREALRPVVAPRQMFETLRLTTRLGKTRTVPMAWRPLAGGLAVAVVYDTPVSIMYVTEEHLTERWRLPFARALSIALDNLLTASRYAPGFARVSRGLFRSVWRDNYDPARMLLPELFAGLGLRGPPVVCAPHRDALLVADSADPAALRALARTVRGEITKPRRIAAGAYLLGPGGWQPYLPDTPSSRLAALFRALWLQDRHADYQESAPLVQAACEHAGRDAFVASHRLTPRAERGVVSSYAAWTKGVATLLPRVDFLVFLDLNRPDSRRALGHASWERIQAVTGLLSTPADETYPERYLVETFPTPEQLAALGV